MPSHKSFSQQTVIVPSIEVQNRGSRLDPTHFNERCERIIRHFRSLPIKKINIGSWSEVSEVFVPGRFKRPFVESSNHGVPLLGSSSMLALRLPKDALISKDFKKLPSLMIRGGEILLSCSGTIGVSILCGESFKGFAISQHAARIRASEKVRGYLHAYLSAQIGREMVLQQNYGKVIKELTEDQIKDIVVPIVGEPEFSRINKLMIRATRHYDTARFYLEETEAEIQRVLRVTGKIEEPKLWLSRQNKAFLKPQDSLLNYRIDPHFYDPDIAHLKNKLTALPHKTLGQIADVWMPPRFARLRADVGYGVPFYSSAGIMRARRVPSSTL